ncbi:hypothetical protein D3C83_262380 [compost metagenome]
MGDGHLVTLPPQVIGQHLDQRPLVLNDKDVGRTHDVTASWGGELTEEILFTGRRGSGKNG